MVATKPGARPLTRRGFLRLAGGLLGAGTVLAAQVGTRVNLNELPALGGGAVSGGAVSGGAVSGGAVSGGAVSGGAVSGGAVSGGAVSGGAVSGGAVSGGAVSGGAVSGGAVSGGAVSGGAVSGGAVSGGALSSGGGSSGPFAPPALAAPDYHLAVAPGWMGNPRTLAIFDVTGLAPDAAAARLETGRPAVPLLWLDQGRPHTLWFSYRGQGAAAAGGTDPAAGLAHFHGFYPGGARGLNDGGAGLALIVPGGSTAPFACLADRPGTYFYHLAVEGASARGAVFVRVPGGQVAYPAAPEVTRYDREYGLLIGEAGPELRSPAPDGGWVLLNGLVYPETPMPAQAAGAPPGLVACAAGERVLLRLANLGAISHALAVDELPLRVVARNGAPLADSGGTDHSFPTHTLHIGPGEAYDVIFTAPAYRGPGYVAYLLYDRRLAPARRPQATAAAGALTEIHVYPAGALAPQTAPQTWDRA